MARQLDQPHDRGEFFKSLGTLMAGFMAARVEDAVTSVGPTLLRPPGALDEFDFLLACTRCDKCIKACPQGTLFRAGPGAALAAGTPAMDPRLMPCFLCTELPCIPACPEGALVWPTREVAGEPISGPAAVQIGTARVKSSICITYDHEESPAQACTTCVDRCPYPGRAIAMAEPAEGEQAHPVVFPEVCTGCGLCTFGCPTPNPAIVVEKRD